MLTPRGRAALVGTAAVVAVLAGWGLVSAASHDSSSSASGSNAGSHASGSGRPGSSASAAPTVTEPAQGKASDRRHLVVTKSIGGEISPKSVVASGLGLVFAQNMMYRHTVTVYASNGTLVRTIPDSVRLSSFGVKGHPGVSRGAPVEVAFSPDRKYAYVSNYSMYGAGFGPEGVDTCTPSSAAAAGDTPSYVYRIAVSTLKVDKVIKVGLVPKYVAVTPDGSKLLVTDWCSWDLRVIDVATWKQVAAIPMGAYPRGIAVSPDSRRAYVAVMGSTHLAVVDLRKHRITHTVEVGSGPRHVVVSPDGRYVYATLNGAGQVVKVGTRTLRVVGRVSTGTQPRSMVLAADGRSAYVVNYVSNTVSKIRTRDMKVLQTVDTGKNPVGVTYDPVTHDVWVAVYTGSLLVLHDKA